MPQAKHTPWWAGGDDDAHMVYGEDNRAIADASLDDGDADAEAAHARLIAAAPDLLAVCKEIANGMCDLRDSERRIRLYAAITKAIGKGWLDD
jgi:hypothetical protein